MSREDQIVQLLASQGPLPFADLRARFAAVQSKKLGATLVRLARRGRIQRNGPRGSYLYSTTEVALPSAWVRPVASIWDMAARCAA